ncbi:MAG TPA: FAD-binding oxidoreductase, partial [Actinomycetes bacterium]|nr:FAD-binding oxidoreductase [Actinomycetes bacterium]
MDIPRFRGPVLTSSDAAFDDARKIWNGAIDRKPAVIARCTEVADVIAALRYARSHDLLVSVRGGGHGVAGHALNDGGIVIDLSLLRGVRVDPVSRTALAEPGVLWGDFDQATQAAGLATTGGIVTHTGIAGLTLGGGIGWLMRAYGTTADNLIAADVITADGSLVHASDREDPELLWGLRGGGGNFGIVTSFRYRLHDVGPTVLAGPVVWPMEDAPEVMRFYREFCRNAPDQLTTIAQYRTLPAFPVFPAEFHGRKVLQIGSVWAGDPAEGQRVLAPLRGFGQPLFDLVGPKEYVANQGANDKAVPHGWHYYWKSADLAELQDETIDIITEHAFRMRSPRSYCIIFQLGGAVSRVGEDETAYSHRAAAFNVNINGVWQPDENRGEHESAWVRGLF